MLIIVRSGEERDLEMVGRGCAEEVATVAEVQVEERSRVRALNCRGAPRVDGADRGHDVTDG